jgi:hypothetical protein
MQAPTRKLFVSRRPEDRSPIAENNQTVPAFAAARIELKVDVPATGETAKLPQQLVAVHRHWIAGCSAVVKSGKPMHLGSMVRG